jgi:hypothetical protein
MIKKYKHIIIGLSVLGAAGIGYYIYSRIRIAQLNKKILTLSEVEQSINDIQVDNTDIPVTEPELPLPSPEFSGDYGANAPDNNSPYGTTTTDSTDSTYADYTMDDLND